MAPSDEPPDGTEGLPATFHWEGWDVRGEPCHGEVMAEDPYGARRQLARGGIQVARLRRRPPPRGRPTVGERALFARQLAVMVRAGIPLSQALTLLAEAFPQPRLRHEAAAVHREVAGGTLLAAALARHPTTFDPLFCNLVAVGEQSGRLDEVLERLAAMGERLEAIRRRVRRALIYPAVVLVVALAVTLLLLVAVVPTFEALYAGLGAELPEPTRAVLDLSEGVRRHGPWLLPVLALVGGVAALLLHRLPRLRGRLGDAALRLPLMGPLLHRGAGTRFARTLATLTRAGVPLLEGLESSGATLSPPAYRRAVTNTSRAVADGEPLYRALAQSALFAPLLIQLVRVGEESGTLDALLDRAADVQEADLEARVETLTTLLEPLLMVFLGAMLGLLVVAMYLPIFRMGEAITGGY